MNVTDNAVATAVIAALNAGGASSTCNAFDLDALKKLTALPTTYTEVTVSRRFDGQERNDSFRGTDSYRLTVRQCALGEVYNARELRRRTRANLEYTSITVDAFVSSPVQFETAEDIGEDEQGYWSGLETYTLTF